MASEILYRPLFNLSAMETIAISQRHGLKLNPLYSMGFERVGCLPCIMCKKNELRQIAKRFPEAIDRIERWEAIVQMVSRRGAATFFAAKMLPMDEHGDTRAAIRRAVDWALTTRGGRNYDMFAAAEMDAADKEGWLCESAYGLCE